MPYTFAHPAIVLPLLKSRLPLSITGLIVGSMIPDLQFLIQLKEVENMGRHWQGILLFDIPATLLLSFLFHHFLRNSLIANLPESYRLRFRHLQAFEWNRSALTNKAYLVISAYLGVMSHLAWDACTHHDGLIVEWIPALSSTIPVLSYHLPVYFSLQITCSLLGMIIIHRRIMQLPIRSVEPDTLQRDDRYWKSILLLFLTILAWRLFLWPSHNSFGGVLIAITGSLLYSWIFVSFLLRKHFSPKKIKS